METRLLIALAAVVLLRLPFLDQAIQGDDVYYLAIARNVAVDPLHPMQMGYTFQGDRVSMAGHPHPPLNAYLLALLLRISGDVREPLFHACYIVFSLVAAAAVFRLARRFTERPLLATFLFLAVPAFVVNGNSLEADLPFLAFWLLGFALYFDGRHRLASASLGLSALAAYQAVFAVPILAHHVWHHRRRSKTAWLAVAAAPLALAGWQLFQLFSAGSLPGGVLAGYLQTYGLLALSKKLHSAAALVSHLGWIVFPPASLSWPGSPAALGALALPGYAWWQRMLLALSLAAGLGLLIRWIAALRRDRSGDSGFLAAWGLVFFAASALAFFAGSARYLLPLAPAAIFTILRDCRRTWLLWPAAAANLALGLTLASANFHHWDQYRRFAAGLQPLAGDRRVWFQAEWGLRYYLERIGAEPLERGQPLYPGSILVTSRLAGAGPLSAAGGPRREVLRSAVWARPPVRLFGLATRSGYSSSDLGLLPFDLGPAPLDHLQADILGLPEVRASYLRMSDPDAAPQLLSGFYPIENNAWRWIAGQGVVLLKASESATRFEMTFFIPDAAPARRITVALNDLTIADQAYPAPGRYVLSAPVRATGAARITVSVDQTFRPPGDQRLLGVIVQELGLR